MRDPSVGDRVDQYQLTDLLARSGMASIFKAIDTDSGQPVALKIPHIQYESDVVFSERFRREEETGQTLSHPNVVRILKPREKSGVYMAMEFVEGKSLRALMNGKVPFPARQALDVAAQVLDALAYLHDNGVVHRDIKPENILLTPSGQVKILDFGIALFVAERRLTWTGLSSTVGTPDYMAPEQIKGRRGDPRTDVYAVGMMLYELLTCNLPFDATNPRALLKAKTSEEPRPPSYYVPGFDPSLEALILKAIERDPRHRYNSARQMLADVKDPASVPPRDPLTGETRRRERARATRRLMLGAAIAALLVGLAILVRLSAGQTVPGAPAPVTNRAR
jgi:serine/threonine-protein kinase